MTPDDMSDARLHVGHADLVLTVCATPPDVPDGAATITGACTVADFLPGAALAEAARLVRGYADDLMAEAHQRMGRA